MAKNIVRPLIPTWALLVPCNIEWLLKESQEIWLKLYGKARSSPEPWRIREGQGVYSALVDLNPGSEGIETKLAKHLFPKLGKTIYVLWFREDFDFCWTYAGANRTSELSTPPLELAEKLGCPLNDLF